jgi:hypothetical protein
LPTRTMHSPVQRRHRGVVARSPASRRRASATARSAPKQSADPGTTDGSVSRPARSAIPGRQGASLEVSHVPFSTRRSRRALAPKAAGLRTCPAPAFMPAFRPRFFHGPRSVGIRPCGFSLFRRDRRGVARSGGRSGWVVRSSLTCRAAIPRSCACKCQPVTRSLIEKTRSPSSSGPSRGWGRCSRLVFFCCSRSCSRTLAADPSVRAHLTPRPSRRPSRVMHRRVL